MTSVALLRRQVDARLKAIWADPEIDLITAGDCGDYFRAVEHALRRLRRSVSAHG